MLMLGDCLERMAEIPAGSVDMVLCDLPYGISGCAWDTVIPLAPLWDHYRRVIRGNGAIVLTASQPFTTTLISSNPAWFKYCWVWDKVAKGDIFNAKNKPMKRHEDICVFSAGTTANGSARRMPYYPIGITASDRRPEGRNRRAGAFRGVRPSHNEVYQPQAAGYPSSILRVSNADRTNIIHPTQKPVALLEYLIRTYTQQGETVLDNAMGSGSTGVACASTNRRFIGIERDPEYFALASARIEAATLPQLEAAD
jgi:site-specific DNA-methyltransferase (adenine-specific)